ncbi:MAG: hypothetical protein ACR2GG_03870 [Gemmatimonadaceae bacterium]
MLRTLFFIGVIIVVASVALGAVLGIAAIILVFALKVLVFGAIAYLAIRIISPRTAAQLRDRVERQTLPRI